MTDLCCPFVRSDMIELCPNFFDGTHHIHIKDVCGSCGSCDFLTNGVCYEGEDHGGVCLDCWAFYPMCVDCTTCGCEVCGTITCLEGEQPHCLPCSMKVLTIT